MGTVREMDGYTENVTSLGEKPEAKYRCFCGDSSFSVGM